jgi:molybdopterin-containing oxidoreductase family iron-sulfur binding subunit
MLCQHCERAPCEYVCTVAATVHSPDGLNEMVYNRCVGTRFCSNNCPYKVRRFNWFDYNAEVSETERLAKNPDVTVRARGVMEKCTFCVQRIREAEIAARVDGRPLETGEVRTACQQACPTQAIVFGSLTDADDPVGALRDQPRAYSVLHELGTEPRVRYLARITNPNPTLAEQT